MDNYSLYKYALLIAMKNAVKYCQPQSHVRLLSLDKLNLVT